MQSTEELLATKFNEADRKRRRVVEAAELELTGELAEAQVHQILNKCDARSVEMCDERKATLKRLMSSLDDFKGAEATFKSSCQRYMAQVSFALSKHRSTTKAIVESQQGRSVKACEDAERQLFVAAQRAVETCAQQYIVLK